MPQKLKYVGPQDSKVLRGYHFVRDVSDDASGGRNAVEVPDAIANIALKARPIVFLQAHQPVPDEVKAQRDQLPVALEREGAQQVKHWSRRLAVSETLPDDNPKQKERKAGEIAGAQRQVDTAMEKLRAAHALKAERRAEYTAAGLPIPAELEVDLGADVPNSSADLLAEVARLRAALEAKDSELVNLREEIIGSHEQQDEDEAEQQAEAQGEKPAAETTDKPAAGETAPATGRPKANRRTPAPAPAAETTDKPAAGETEL